MDHANTKALYRYWNGLRKGREAPFRSEIDPREISSALETIFILEVLDEDDMRFRLAGTGLCEMIGMEARGMVAESIMDDGHGAELVDLASRVVRHPGVGVMRIKSLAAGGEDQGRAMPAQPFESGPQSGSSQGETQPWRGEILLLPMRSELGRMDRVLGAINLIGRASRAGMIEPMRFRCLGARLLLGALGQEVVGGRGGDGFEGGREEVLVVEQAREAE